MDLTDDLSIIQPFLITPLGGKWEILLGMTTLNAARPGIDWDKGTLLFPLRFNPDGPWEIPTPVHVKPTRAKGVTAELDARAHFVKQLFAEGYVVPPAYLDSADLDPQAPTTADDDSREADTKDSHPFVSVTNVRNLLSPGIPATNVPKASKPETASHFFDPDEDPDDIAAILHVVPPRYHKFVDVFSKIRADDLPPHRSYDHGIELLDEKDLPPVGPIYSTAAPEAKALKVEIDDLLSKGFIRPSKAPIGAPVLFVKKKEGTLRMCIDYRQLNLRTRKNKYPLPPINLLLEQLSAAKIFSKLDLRGAYHRLRIAQGHEWKTTFRCRYGSFEFLVMPFGLTNAPSAFQHYINDVLHPYLDQFVVVYLDDILIYSTNEDEHEAHVTTVLKLLRDHKLYAKASKCEFHVTKVEFLGYVVGADGLTMDMDKVNSIIKWPVPRNVKAVQSFLGFANFYRRFIRNYSKLATPLTQLTKKDTNSYGIRTPKKPSTCLRDPSPRLLFLHISIHHLKHC